MPVGTVLVSPIRGPLARFDFRFAFWTDWLHIQCKELLEGIAFIPLQSSTCQGRFSGCMAWCSVHMPCVALPLGPTGLTRTVPMSCFRLNTHRHQHAWQCDRVMQVAHFLEADLHPWAAALAAARFDSASHSAAVPADAPHPSERGSSAPAPLTRRADAWRLLGDLTPLGDTVDTALRASHQPLLQQLPLTPAKWQPAVVRSHAVAGALTLDSAAVDACCDVMPALHGVESLSLHLNCHRAVYIAHAEEWALRRAATALASLPALRRLKVETGRGVNSDSLKRLLCTMSSVLRPASLNSSGENATIPLGHLPAMRAARWESGLRGPPTFAMGHLRDQLDVVVSCGSSD